MVDINNIELNVGDKVLVAFSSCGNCYMEYARIIFYDGNYSFKISFLSNKYFKGKTRSINIYNSKMMKVNEGY